jgi:PAS domain S-box-containing protein
MVSTPGMGILQEALNAPGEVARDLRRLDWSATAVGLPATWPSSLATMVRVLLGSRFSMWMAWGPELTFFCNDAYRRDTLGTKYPWALGRSASEVWAEIWPEIGPRIERVMGTGEATWDEALLLFLERSGYPEETYHTFSYSPIPDESGAIAGMLCVVSEETERVIAERHMATLRDLGSVPAAAGDESVFLCAAADHLAASDRSLPFTLVYLAGEDGALRLAAATGVREGDPVAPTRIELSEADSPWPFASAGRGTVVVPELGRRLPQLPTGAWERPPTAALVTPLADAAGGEPYGYLVAGVNPFRPLDGDMRSFVELIAQRLAAGIAGARSLDAERRRAEQLADLDRSKTAFFSNVSHEFRTPLTLMLAPLEDARSEAGALEPGQVELVHRNGLRLLKLVNALLDFSRLEAGRMEASFRPTDVSRLTAELASTFSDATRRAGLELIVDCPATTAPVYLDPDLWERVVLNLLSNAFKATLRGGIRVAVREDGDAVALEVSDTGPGIAAEELPRLFQRFHRVRSVAGRSHEGTGIGLALVRELVELHGGEVSVRSRVGEGTTFTVRIPYGYGHLPAEMVVEEEVVAAARAAELFVEEALGWLEADAATVSPAETSRTRPPAQQAGGRVDPPAARVLVADDNRDLRSYLVRLLAPIGEVETAANGAEALAAIRRRPPDLLVADMMMPGMDGLGLLRELRREPATQELPVIMLSARAGEDASIAGLQAGADDYLPKPFSGRELLARVRAHLDLSLVRRQASAEIRAERQLLEQTLKQLPSGVIIAEAPSGRIVLSNSRVEEILGHPPLPVENVQDYAPYQTYTLDGRLIAMEERALTRAIRDGISVDGELQLYRTGRGELITRRITAAPVRDEEGRIVAGVAVFEDVTEELRNQELLRAQRDILARIARGEPLQETLSEIVRTVQRLSEWDTRASILLLSEDGRHLHHGAAPDLPPAYNEAIDGIDVGFAMGSCGAAAHLRETVVAEDLEADERWAAFRELAREHELRACWSMPIFATDGRLVGTFAVYHGAPHRPGESDRRLVGLLARTAAVAIERHRDARTRARQLGELQSSLLPRRLPRIPRVQTAVRYHPGDRSLEVGGDFYDLFALDGDSWGFVIGDVRGHGAQAAAVTALTRHTTRAVARMVQEPGEVLRLVSDALLNSGYERFCSAVYGRLELAEDCVRFQLACGGHPPPLLRSAGGQVTALEQHGPLLGIFADTQFPTLEGRLEPGAAMLLYTDGLVERNPRLERESDLALRLAEIPAQGAEPLLAELERVVLGERPAPRDDVAILVLRGDRP